MHRVSGAEANRPRAMAQPRARRRLGGAFAAVLSIAVIGCDDTPVVDDSSLTVEELMDPKACAECHQSHYDQWAGSMHAYAAEDPVFVAMNELGQKETGGKLGTFCVNCHAPMAVQTGATDGTDVDKIPEHLKGVTCYFCHNVQEVTGKHNNPLVLAMDTTMRGGFTKPVRSPAHRSEYSPLTDSDEPESATLCGSCHDIVVEPPVSPAKVHLERTFEEWSESIFSPENAVRPSAVLTCGSTCHMVQETGPAAEGPGLAVKTRTLHRHEFPGVDVALTRFPDTGDKGNDKALQTRHENLVQQALDTSLRVELCVNHQGAGGAAAEFIRVTLDNFSSGHRFPSGAAQDRRVWVEVRAYAAGKDEPVYEGGIVPDGVSPVESPSPDMWILRDKLLDAEGNEVHMFWEGASLDPEKQSTLGAAVTIDPLDGRIRNTHGSHTFPGGGKGIPEAIDRVTVLVRVQPIGLEVLDHLIHKKVLDADHRKAMPTFDVVPNRHLKDDPELSSLASVTFEWSEATKSSRYFDSFTDTEGTSFPWDCVAMQRKPR